MVSKHIADNIGTLDRLFTSDTHRSRPQFYGSGLYEAG
jgi:hypothetical protein